MKNGDSSMFMAIFPKIKKLKFKHSKIHIKSNHLLHAKQVHLVNNTLLVLFSQNPTPNLKLLGGYHLSTLWKPRKLGLYKIEVERELSHCKDRHRKARYGVHRKRHVLERVFEHEKVAGTE